MQNPSDYFPLLTPDRARQLAVDTLIHLHATLSALQPRDPIPFSFAFVVPSGVVDFVDRTIASEPLLEHPSEWDSGPVAFIDLARVLPGSSEPYRFRVSFWIRLTSSLYSVSAEIREVVPQEFVLNGASPLPRQLSSLVSAVLYRLRHPAEFLP